jgi:hypothetical protein
VGFELSELNQLKHFRYKESMANFKQIAVDAHGREVKQITPAHWKALFNDFFFT